ncbi:hypothetical protein LZC95_45630 [Pendulispora brunnea]|uniref:Uncharacterized protein n=1 Tax=Pendulispora brunnea TaxID=2905690 RepID=A0ABZ2K4T7_9BACT
MMRTWAIAVGGFAALGGVTFFFWKIGSPPAQTAAAVANVAESEAGADACTALHDANEAVLEKLQQGKKDCHIVRPDLGCVTTRTGVTWGYRIARTRTEPAEMPAEHNEIQDCATDHDVELVRRDSAGTKVLAGGHETLSYTWSTKQNDLSLEALADYDGDGEIEILRLHDALAHEGSPEHDVAVLTFKDGDVKPYPPAAALKIDAQRDIDGDGRPDLLSRGPYASVTVSDALGNEWNVGSAMFAYHALPNGAFELGDAASIAYTRSRCPSAPKDVPITLDDTTGATGHEALADSLVCARLWGMPQEKIDRAWGSVCRGFDATENPFGCQTWPTALASIAPPFTLR